MQDEKDRLVIEHQTDLVCHSLSDTTITYANTAYCKFFGVDQKEIIGKRWLDFYPSSQWPIFQKIWADLYLDPSKVLKDITSIKDTDGKIRWIEWIDHSIVNNEGQVVEIQGVGRDITAQKVLEETLKNSEKKHRVLLDSIPCLVFRLDREGKIEFVNQFARKFFGKLEKKLVGLPLLNRQIRI